ncbi:MAG: CPBP family intramembrane glutamic endopeptidase [Chloroflexota bacterium]
MTPVDPGDPDVDDVRHEELLAPPATARPGQAIFSLEGRAAPGLYLVGWLGVLLGVALAAVAILASGGSASFASRVLLVFALLVLGAGFAAAAGAQALDRRRKRRAGRYHGPSPFLVLAADIPLALVALTLIVAPIANLGLDVTAPAGIAASQVVLAVCYIGLVRLLVVGTGALSWRDMGAAIRGTRVGADLAFGAVIAIPVWLVSILFGAVLARFLPLPESVLPQARTAVDLGFNLVTAVLIAPIGEELFFRGFATTAWARDLGPVRGLARGAIVFAAAHILDILAGADVNAPQLALFAFLVRLPVAFVLGYVFLTRRSLPASIGLHAAYNAIPLLLLGVIQG